MSNHRHRLPTLVLASLLALGATALAQQPSIHQLQSEEHAAMSDDARSVPPSPSGRADITPRGARALGAKVLGWMPYWIAPAAYDELDWTALTTIAWFSLELEPATGAARTLRGWPAAALRDRAHANGVKFVLTVTNFGTAANETLLGDASRRSAAIATIVDAVASGNGDGVNIDFESVPGTQRDNLTAFMIELATRLRAAVPGAEITMAIPAVDWGNAFDVAALGALCDALVMMGYDYHWRNAPTAGPVAPLAGESWNVTRSVQTYLARGLAPSKLMLGVPWYGYEWPTIDSTRGSATSGAGRAVIYADAVVYGPANGRLWDEPTSTPWTRYFVEPQWLQLWYDDSLSLSLKYRFARESDLAGIGIWALGYQGTGGELWEGIHQAFDVPTAVAGEARRDAGGLRLAGDRVTIELDRARHVRVDLHDVVGRHVATLLDDDLRAGRHDIAVPHDALAAGAYVISSSMGSMLFVVP